MNLPDCLGLVMPHHRSLHEGFYSRAAATFMALASNRSHSCQVYIEEDIQELIKSGKLEGPESLGCKGLLYFCPTDQFETVIKELLAVNVAVGLIRRRMPSADGLYQASDDDHRGMNELLGYLGGTLQCERFVYAGQMQGKQKTLSGRERAFRKYLVEKLGAEDRLEFIWEEGETAIWCAELESFVSTAREEAKKLVVICATDTIALCMIGWLKDRGYSVPGDVLVTGYNNDSNSVRLSPAITTMNIPVEEMVAGACRYLCEYRTGQSLPEASIVRYFHELVIRETTR